MSPAKKVEPSAGTQQLEGHLNTLGSAMKRKWEVKTEKYNMEELAYPMHEMKSELCKSEGTPSKQIKITSYDEFEAYLTPTRG